MSERLVVDSIMTADGEVVPLGPVDKDGHRVPLDTGELYGEDGKCINVGYFLYFPFTNEWFIEEMLSRSRFGVSELHLKAPDSWEKMLLDLGEALQQGGRSGNSVCAYLAARGLCRGHMDAEGKCKLSDVSFCANGMVSNIRGRIKRLEDVRERSLDRPNVMSVTCPSCGMSNRIAWGSLMATPQKEAVSMLADSWNSR